MTVAFPEYIDSLPTIAGHEADLEQAIRDAATTEVFRPENKIDFGRIKSACAIALHMHQPLIPAGGGDLRTAADHQQPQVHDGQPGHRRQPQRAGVSSGATSAWASSSRSSSTRARSRA